MLGITIHLPFRITLSITAISSQNNQYPVMSCGIWPLLSSQLCLIYFLDTVGAHRRILLVVAHALSCNLVC